METRICNKVMEKLRSFDESSKENINDTEICYFPFLSFPLLFLFLHRF